MTVTDLPVTSLPVLSLNAIERLPVTSLTDSDIPVGVTTLTVTDLPVGVTSLAVVDLPVTSFGSLSVQRCHSTVLDQRVEGGQA